MDVAHKDTKEYTSHHTTLGVTLHESGGAVHTEYNVNAARGTEAWKPQAATQAPFYLFYKEILGMFLWQSENTDLGYFEINHIALMR